MGTALAADSGVASCQLAGRIDDRSGLQTQCHGLSLGATAGFASVQRLIALKTPAAIDFFCKRRVHVILHLACAGNHDLCTACRRESLTARGCAEVFDHYAKSLGARYNTVFVGEGAGLTCRSVQVNCELDVALWAGLRSSLERAVVARSISARSAFRGSSKWHLTTGVIIDASATYVFAPMTHLLER